MTKRSIKVYGSLNAGHDMESIALRFPVERDQTTAYAVSLFLKAAAQLGFAPKDFSQIVAE
jgi:hypothetical protein